MREGRLEEPSQSPTSFSEEALCVLLAYGPSTYELEETLYHKYMVVCQARRKGEQMQFPRDKFHLLLDKLSEGGYLKLISRGDKLYWMRLRSPLELEEGEELTPEKASQMIDEARAKRQAEEQASPVRKGKEEQEPQKPTIGEMADVILSQLLKEHGTEKIRAYVAKGETEDVRKPIKEMHEALISGEDEFRLYVERSIPPRMKGQLTYYLAAAGRDALLAALAVSLMIPLHPSPSTDPESPPA
jgi:hypothetical protein